MNIDVKLALLISLWGFVFVGASSHGMEEALVHFSTNWIDVVKGLIIGIILGLILRIDSVSDYINSKPFGSLVTGTGIGIVGLGAIGLGIVGALVVYFKLGVLEFVVVPLHASVVGLSAVSIYIVSHWKFS